MSDGAFDLDDTDDIGFVDCVRPIIGGVVHSVEPVEVYVVKIDSWFTAKWLGFSSNVAGAVGVQHRETLRVPPFAPARVRSQRFFVRDATGTYVLKHGAQELHVAHSSDSNARRLMSVICPDAAVFWWSGDTQRKRCGCLMAYLPTDDGHAGWYAELDGIEQWTISNTLGTTAKELAAYADDNRDW